MPASPCSVPTPDAGVTAQRAHAGPAAPLPHPSQCPRPCPSCLLSVGPGAPREASGSRPVREPRGNVTRRPRATRPRNSATLAAPSPAGHAEEKHAFWLSRKFIVWIYKWRQNKYVIIYQHSFERRVPCHQGTVGRSPWRVGRAPSAHRATGHCHTVGQEGTLSPCTCPVRAPPGAA